MWDDQGLSTESITAIFQDELAKRRGKVTDQFNDGHRLFVRGVLPRLGEVQPGDRMMGGVAVRAVDGEISVHPYLYRLVCGNGAILAHTLQSRQLDAAYLANPDTAEDALREAVSTCCDPSVFKTGVGELRSTLTMQVDSLLRVGAFAATHNLAGIEMLPQILQRVEEDGGPTRFGLVNAITATARDTRDPQTRWDLETLGAAVAAGMPMHLQHPRTARAPRRSIGLLHV